MAHATGRCFRLVRIGKHAQGVELEIADEPRQLIELRSRLAGESRDHRRANVNARNAIAQPGQQILGLLPVDTPVHRLQNAVVNVLERNINILNDVLALRDRVNHGLGQDRRIYIHQPQPLKPIDRIQSPQQIVQPERLVEFLAVAGRVLADQANLNRPVGNQLARLAHDGFGRFAVHRPAYRRNPAKRTFLIAAFADPQKRIMGRRQPQPREIELNVRVIVTHVYVRAPTPSRTLALQNRPHDIVTVVDTDQRVNPIGRFEQRFPVPLHQTPSHHDPPTRAIFLPGYRPLNHRQRFVSRSP